MQNDIKKIRNFSIIAHIDHGKSTLADRMIELTKTVEVRKMRDQVLDRMELEQERGITIKMQPVRMEWKDYILNLIDTPGHIDFSYEVSRALKAVEGSILLVDATQGVQAQTFTTLDMAKEQGLVIIPVLSKIDSPLARVEEIKFELATLLDIETEEILEVSGKTGEGVEELFKAVIERVPEPKQEHPETKSIQSLVFDFEYSSHKGVIVYIRNFEGAITKGDQLSFATSGEKFFALEVGTFSPEPTPKDSLLPGEIGYVVTGIKKPGLARVGDTVTLHKDPFPALPGYMDPLPVVWASIYPESQDDFNTLKDALGKLRLSDSSFSYDEESSGSLGRGYRCGFLGMLHLEIITERLRREFNLELVVTLPSIVYHVIYKGKEDEEIIYSPHLFPNDGMTKQVTEPWVRAKIITPSEYLGPVMQLLFEHEALTQATENFGERMSVEVDMPLRELMRNFFDNLKSVSSGYASVAYEITEYKEADVVRLDILIGDEVMHAFTRVVSRVRAQEEAEKMVEKIHKVMPRQQVEMKVQGRAFGRVISSKALKAFRKDVTGSLYGGDITRKKKLLEKQKKGKKKMATYAKVNIPHDVFLKVMRSGD
ncbi:MAG: GTP-binding protein LepA [Candidatus Paceibacteria bacterium]|jgi:GTP-binding protein LepA